MRKASLFLVGLSVAPLVAALASAASAAEPLVVAEPPSAAAPAPGPAPVAVTSPAGPAAPPADAETRPERRHEGVSLGGTLYMLSGAAVDDGSEGGFMVRPALELGISIGAGDVGVFVGGLLAGVEVVDFGSKRSLSYPAMTVVGAYDDKWLVAVAGGASIAADDSYADHGDDERSVPSPRAELRGAYRFGPAGLLEVGATVGAERRLFSNRDDQTRVIAGISFGFAGR
jgi:hypothetical protein